MRRILVLVVLAAVGFGGLAAGSASRPSAAGSGIASVAGPRGRLVGAPVGPVGPVVYRLPLAGPAAVLRPFQPPPTPYSAGHRGVDLQAPQGGRVLAAADGTVRFAGSVAGRGVVVLAHADGITTEYEPVRPLVHPGMAVQGGQPVAVISGRHAGCPVSCLHWGARRGAVYLDPMGLLRPLGPVVLLPWPRDG